MGGPIVGPDENINLTKKNLTKKGNKLWTTGGRFVVVVPPHNHFNSKNEPLHLTRVEVANREKYKIMKKTVNRSSSSSSSSMSVLIILIPHSASYAELQPHYNDYENHNHHFNVKWYNGNVHKNNTSPLWHGIDFVNWGVEGWPGGLTGCFLSFMSLIIVYDTFCKAILNKRYRWQSSQDQKKNICNSKFFHIKWKF